MNDWSTIAFWQHDLHKFVAFGAHDFPTLVGRARNFRFHCGLVYVSEPGTSHLWQHGRLLSPFDI
ncbi:hypothetical protein CsSME_00040485 [Camellia sinensis var. sinensis]